MIVFLVKVTQMAQDLNLTYNKRSSEPICFPKELLLRMLPEVNSQL